MFVSNIITTLSLVSYKDRIPEKYYNLLLAEELTLTAVRKDRWLDGEPVGFAITNAHEDWLEIIWVDTEPGYRSDTFIAEFLRYIVRSARRLKRYTGVFIQIHNVEVTERTEPVLRMAGFEITPRVNNIFRFRLEDVSASMLKEGKCTFLCDADDDLLRKVEDVISSDPRDIPVQIPVPRNDYVQELSLLYHDDKERAGLLLFSKLRDCLVFELAYSSDPVILRTLLGSAYKKACELYGPGQIILAPIVMTGSVKLTEHLVPNAKCGQLLEAVIRFSSQVSTQSLPTARPD